MLLKDVLILQIFKYMTIRSLENVTEFVIFFGNKFDYFLDKKKTNQLEI